MSSSFCAKVVEHTVLNDEDEISEKHNFEGIEAKENVGIVRDFGRRDTGQETDGRIGGLVGNQGILDTRHLTVLPGFASKGVSSPLIEVISESFSSYCSMDMSTFAKTSIEAGFPRRQRRAATKQRRTTTTTTATTDKTDKTAIRLHVSAIAH